MPRGAVWLTFCVPASATEITNETGALGREGSLSLSVCAPQGSVVIHTPSRMAEHPWSMHGE